VPFRAERNAVVTDTPPVRAEVVDAEAGTVRVEVDRTCDLVVEPVTTARLGVSYQAEMPFTNPDGSDLDLSTDLLGARRYPVVPGPFGAAEVTRTLAAPGPAPAREVSPAGAR